jgi:hypothetical protein
MKRFISASLALLMLQGAFSFILMPTSISGQTAAETTVQAPKAPLGFGLEDGTPVKLRLNRNLSSKDAKTGETIDFQVLEDVKFGDIIIVPIGGIALGTVTRAKPKGRMGKSGKLDIRIDSVQLASGEKVPLRAVKENKGKSRTGTMTGAMVATGILFFPAAPLFLFMKGKDIAIPEGTGVTAYVDGDFALDRARFIDANNGAEETEEPSSKFSSVSVSSTPERAEILVNGKFMGSTPSTLQLEVGEHTLTVRKAGYVVWERTITLNAGGSVTVDAELEEIPDQDL